MMSLKMALKSIAANKMRSFLTTLGIIIGVLAIVVMTSLVGGATDSVTSQVKELGADTITVTIKDKKVPISTDDLQALRSYRGVLELSPFLSAQTQARNSAESYETVVHSVDASFFDIRKIELAEGRYVLSPDVENATYVCLIGPDVEKELFGAGQGVGKTLWVFGNSLEIVGVIQDGETGISGSENANIYIPFSTGTRITGQKNMDSFVMKVDESLSDEVEKQVNLYLLNHFKGDEDAFEISNQSAIMDTVSTVTSTMTMLLTGIAAISLLVGGIGIMNIMLVSVTERTREIGIRKAIGARRSNILIQFLVEALTLSLLGGILGVAVSWGLLAMISIPMGMTLTLSPNIVFVALGFSLLVGLVFGIYPANKASKRKPIEALRYE